MLLQTFVAVYIPINIMVIIHININVNILITNSIGPLHEYPDRQIPLALVTEADWTILLFAFVMDAQFSKPKLFVSKFF